jgi:hypothetical protein
VDEHGVGQPGPLVAHISRGQDSAQVSRNAGDAQQAGAIIEPISEVGDGDALVLLGPASRSAWPS